MTVQQPCRSPVGAGARQLRLRDLLRSSSRSKLPVRGVAENCGSRNTDARSATSDGSELQRATSQHAAHRLHRVARRGPSSYLPRSRSQDGTKPDVHSSTSALRESPTEGASSQPARSRRSAHLAARVRHPSGHPFRSGRQRSTDRGGQAQTSRFRNSERAQGVIVESNRDRLCHDSNITECDTNHERSNDPFT